MRHIFFICKYCLLIAFLLITMYPVKICVFGDYIAEVLMAKALPLSVVLLSMAILFLLYNTKVKSKVPISIKYEVSEPVFCFNTYEIVEL